MQGTRFRVTSLLAPVIDAEVVESLVFWGVLPGFGTIPRIVSLLIAVEAGDLAQVFANSTGSIVRVDIGGGGGTGFSSDPLVI